MRIKPKITGIMTVLVALCAPLVYANSEAGEKSWHHGSGGWRHDQESLAKVLNLTEDQKKQFEAIRAKQKETMKGVFEQLKANRDDFDTEIAKATPDMNKVNELQAQLKAIQGQMIDNHLNLVLDVKKLLTPEQYAGYVALEKSEKLKMRGHHKYHHEGAKDKDKDEAQDEDKD